MTPSEQPVAHASRFTHDAMHTTFCFRFSGIEPGLAASLARECAEKLDALETSLSRFLDGGDIWRINHLRAGETILIGDDCHRCLLQALQAWSDTGGLFDVTLGRTIEQRRSGPAEASPPAAGRLTIHPDRAAVTCEEEGREIDLGGIGKGFALDAIAELLGPWNIPAALLSAGASSHLAVGNATWPIELAGDKETLRLELRNMAMSASGTGIQGNHILHPAGDEAMPTHSAKRLWVCAESATRAEIWSTALMLVSPAELIDLKQDLTEIRQLVVEDQSGLQTIW
jgi:thiamine biosynthesis lipoprotein